jgi:hypothetical protein
MLQKCNNLLQTNEKSYIKTVVNSQSSGPESGFLAGSAPNPLMAGFHRIERARSPAAHRQAAAHESTFRGKPPLNPSLGMRFKNDKTGPEMCYLLLSF